MFAAYNPQSRPSQPVKGKRQVFDNAMVAHVWAQRTQQSGRSANGNFYFQGDTIYSYGRHFPIARFTEATLDGQVVVLFNDDKRSVSTAQHQRYTEGALRGLAVKVLHVPNVEEHFSGNHHAGNVAHLVKAFEALATRLAKPHVRNYSTDIASGTYETLGPAECETARIAALTPAAVVVHEYCEAFGLAPPVLGVTYWTLKIVEAFKRYNDPKRVVKRANADEGRIARQVAAVSKAYAYLEGVYPEPASLAFVSHRVLSNKWSLERDQAYRARALQAAYRPEMTRAVTPEEWQEGKGAAFQHFPTTLVRRKGDKLETSRGAECPFAHAVVAFLKAQECRAKVTSWHRNGQQIRVGVFHVDAIDALGNMQAGCHTIRFDEMRRLAMREIPDRVKACFPLPAVIA